LANVEFSCRIYLRIKEPELSLRINQGDMMKKRQLILALSALFLSFTVKAQNVSTFPSKPLRLVVGFPAGGGADVMTRIIAEGLAKQLGQQVVVDNKPGAEGLIAATEVQRAVPDGHVFLMGTNTTMVALPSLRPNPPFDPFKDFTPISSAGEFSYFLLVQPSLPVKNVKEFLDHVAANPGKFNSASSNSAAELAMLRILDKRKVVNIRYKGDPAALVDMVGGHIHMIIATGTNAPSFVKDGRARALLTLQDERSALLPDVPTAKELGMNNLTIRPWAGFFGPAGMPAPIAGKLSNALQMALASPEVREKLAQQGFMGYGLNPDKFATYFKAQYDGFNQVVREYNIKFE
jgi:tripartite-type tricarboxylate transporter receptor subunit TctC